MTKAVQQWMADEATKYSEHSHDAQGKFIDGLSKGIEIAEGFAEWVDRSPYYIFGPNLWYCVDSKEKLTTSKIIEKYLSSLNNQK